MREYFLRLGLLLKKQFTNRIYICFLILMPICLIVADYYLSNNDTESQIPVGCYFNFNDEDLSEELAVTLNDVSGRLNIIIYDDEKRMLTDTSAAKLECSYVIAENFTTSIAEGDYKNIILVYNSPKTIISDMINELVFAAVYRVAGDEVLYCYANKHEDLFYNESDDVLATLETEYIRQLSSGNTFTLEFNTYDENADSHNFTTVSTTQAFPVRGIIAIFLFLCLLLSVVDYTGELEKGTLIKLSRCKRVLLSSCFIHSWLIPASVVSLITILLSGNAENIFKELIVMLFYYLLLMLFGVLLNILIKKSLILTAIIPIPIIGSLIFTPVIIDIGAIIPISDFVEKLFLPYYYIVAF